MKNIKSIVSFILLLAVTSTGLSSCGSTIDNESDTETSFVTADEAITENNTRQNIPDSLPKTMDFGEKHVRIHIRGDDICIQEITSEMSGDVVDDAIYNRNRIIEERLNLIIEPIITEGWQEYENTTIPALKASILSGEDAYDIVAGWSAKTPSLAAEGYFINLNEVNYLDLSKPWWVQSLVNELDINGKIYFATGDITLTLLGCSYVTYFNQKVAAEYGIGDFYKLVLDGDWTIDKMSELAKGIYKDLNGNNKPDIDDMYGAFVTTTNVADGFLQASGIQMIQKNDNGTYQLALESEKLVSLVEKVYSLFYENEGVFCAGTDAELENCQKLFSDGRSLFVNGSLEVATSTFKTMNDDYGILPYPKFDKKQNEYRTRVQDGLNLYSIPITCKETDMAGAFLEAIAAESYRSVTPAYYDTALKVKYSRDDVSGQMLDIIRDGAFMNFAIIYNNVIGSPWNVMRTLMKEKSKDYASWEAANIKIFETKLKSLIDSMK